MTGMYDQVRPGIGHNQPDEYAEEKKHQKWERWAKKRTFVRALEGTYSHLFKALLEEKRVYSSRDVPWKGGPGQFGKSRGRTARSTATSTARCSTCSKGAATTCTTADTSPGRRAM